MIEPADTSSGHIDGDGPRANEVHPYRRSGSPSNGAGSASSDISHEPQREPDPPHSGEEHAGNEWCALVKWLLSANDRAARALFFLVAILAATVLTVQAVAPHLGDLGGVLSGLGVGIGGTATGAAIARKRRHRQRGGEDG